MVIAIYSFPRRPCTGPMDRVTNLKAVRSPLWSSNKMNMERENTLTANLLFLFSFMDRMIDWFFLKNVDCRNVLLITSWSSAIAVRVSSDCIGAAGLIVVIIRVIGMLMI